MFSNNDFKSNDVHLLIKQTSKINKQKKGNEKENQYQKTSQPGDFMLKNAWKRTQSSDKEPPKNKNVEIRVINMENYQSPKD